VAIAGLVVSCLGMALFLAAGFLVQRWAGGPTGTLFLRLTAAGLLMLAAGIVVSLPLGLVAFPNSHVSRGGLAWFIALFILVRLLIPGVRVTRPHAEVLVHSDARTLSAFLADTRNVVRWEDGVIEVQLISGEAGIPGAEYLSTVSVDGRTTTVPSVLLRHEPGHLVVHEPGRGVSVQSLDTYLLESERDGVRVRNVGWHRRRWPQAVLSVFGDPLGSKARRQSQTFSQQRAEGLARLRALWEPGGH
jgi:hypothetical protein